MGFVWSFLDGLKNIFVAAAPAMPPSIWWMTALVFFVLALTACIDAFTGIVPDGLIWIALLAITGIQGMFGSWDSAALHLRQAIEAAVGIWVVNYLWHRFFKRDALGMGDAKWTMLAVACFGFLPALFAWGIGSCLAVLWLIGSRLAYHPLTRVTFAPFLLCGLVAGLYWLRFRYV